eukprot:1143460-Pelagomonas_calceolata.AAC.2
MVCRDKTFAPTYPTLTYLMVLVCRGLHAATVSPPTVVQTSCLHSTWLNEVHMPRCAGPLCGPIMMPDAYTWCEQEEEEEEEEEGVVLAG